MSPLRAPDYYWKGIMGTVTLEDSVITEVSLEEGPGYCHQTCKSKHMYDPDKDTLRWCENCEIWQHTTTCVSGPPRGLKPHPDDVHLLHRKNPLPDFQGRHILQILDWPIQRAPVKVGDVKVPTSYEVFVTTVRKYYRAGSLPAQWQEELFQALAPLRKDQAQSHFNAMMKTAVPKKQYLCQSCRTRFI
ncbi:hypothetical protein BOTBODRAFT_182335 [Botryobasidium botryosum FD-172 SS1]|uniref:Uncharacterized protein n=1 Tax=Botryobasidium botryosum (strain FD-172 SS1) TaxID=930990 RepID=A0A067M251_BOTB1|nr:hypothetical protein BOTBODRAFT_182335 [Botryobasidium botryosum FD-172 SS1]